MNEQTELAERLRLSRTQLRLSQQDVADHLGIPRPAISEIERGQRKVDSQELKRLAALYGTTPGRLLGEPADPLQTLAHAYAQLATADRHTLLRYAQYLQHCARPPGRCRQIWPPHASSSTTTSDRDPWLTGSAPRGQPPAAATPERHAATPGTPNPQRADQRPPDT